MAFDKTLFESDENSIKFLFKGKTKGASIFVFKHWFTFNIVLQLFSSSLLYNSGTLELH